MNLKCKIEGKINYSFFPITKIKNKKCNNIIKLRKKNNLLEVKNVHDKTFN